MKRVLLLALLLAACQAKPGTPSYVLGDPYIEGGIWYYPQENFTLDETGLGSVIPARGGFSAGNLGRFLRGGALTRDGEKADASALAAAHPTLQLPALARLTNLRNGRQVLVRINDRGPVPADRMVAITARTAQLLAADDPRAIPLRLQVMEDESRRMAVALRPEGPVLAIAAVPQAGVKAETLVPPPGVVGSSVLAAAPATPAPALATETAPPVPLRLPEQVTQVPAHPIQLMIDCGGFSTATAASVLQLRLVALGARLGTDYSAPRERAYTVRIGPLADAAGADAMLQRARAAGATDARIGVD